MCIRDRPHIVCIDTERCPYGVPGDRLWVREPWRTVEQYDHLPPRDVPRTAPIVYSDAGAPWDGISGRYRHARFMPRWASRILLEIISVRAERVQIISEADARAEGVTPLQ